jgi:hypothetical protein
MDKVEKRETFKVVEISGRKFRIEKFDALTGSYLAYQLLNIALPPMLGGLLAKSGIPVGGSRSAGRVMSKQEFFDFQRDCLAACFEVLPAGNMPVITENGFGVIGLEQDLPTVLMLTVHALLFNVQSFFEDGPWAGLLAEMSGISQPDAST